MDSQSVVASREEETERNSPYLSQLGFSFAVLPVVLTVRHTAQEATNICYPSRVHHGGFESLKCDKSICRH